MELIEVRKKLYDILTADADPQGDSPIKATQNMGVAMSNAIKKEGVTIIQMQNVVSKTVIHHVTEALRLLDTMELEQRLGEIEEAEAVEEVPQIEDTRATVEDFFDAAIQTGMSLDDLCKKVGGMYLLAMLDRYEVNEARRRLRIRQPRFDALLEETKNE